MPDENKLNSLSEAGFKIVPTCATCVNYRRGSRAAWGRCVAIAHDHAKHGQQSKTGVPQNGYCGQYELSWADLEDHVGSYIKFYQETPPQS